MADREGNDLRRQIRKVRQHLEANERRRTLLRQRERPHGVPVAGAAFGSGARWVREHPGRPAVAAVVGLLVMTSLVDSASIAGDDPQRSHVAGPSEAGRSGPAVDVTARLIVAGPDRDAETNAGSADDSSAEPDDAPTVETTGGSAADPDAPKGAPSSDQAERVTVDPTGGPTPEPADTSESDHPASEPELSDTGETDEQPVSEPDPADSPEPETPDDETDTGGGTCLGVNALGLTVDLCLPSLLG